MKGMTLEFKDPAQEKKYGLETLAFNIKTCRTICLIALIAHSFYIIKDYVSNYYDTAYFRLFVIVPFFALCYFIANKPLFKTNPKRFQYLAVTIGLLTISYQIIIVLLNSFSYTQITHNVSLIMYGTFIFLGIRFKDLLLFFGPIVIVASLLFSWLIMDYDLSQKIDLTIVLSLNYFIALFAKYNIETHSRVHFLNEERLNIHNAMMIKVNDELQQQRAMYRGVTKRSSDMITIKNMNGKLEFVSEAVKEILGYEPKELIGTEANNLIYKEDMESLNRVREDIQRGKTVKLEYRMIHKDGHPVWVEGIGTPIYNRKKEIVSLQGSIRNIKDKKEIELRLKKSKERLEELNAQKDRFFSIVSHDLRGPIGNIQSLIDFLESSIKKGDMEEIGTIIEYLKKASQNTSNLLHNLLTWSKTQLEGAVVNKVPSNLKEIVNVNYELLKPLIDGKKLVFESEIDESVNVFADFDMVKTVIRNLISNAIKFTPSAGTIKVYTRDTVDNHVEIIVEDTGVGISENRLSKLFDLSMKTSTPGTNEEVGSGLGLILCNDFIHLNDGTMQVHSHEGIGTCVVIKLPKHDPVLSHRKTTLH
ncbi:PAS domain S-box protein [Fulvivirga sp. 29W222]|uniref:histidine kinase n=1 Tax=Fulvivirga marina TaxID=2494733 RepID=A0A937G261_9BACT|nr:PAS domain-containing sensor histidine kinase [Fulvivirga marina]MBL6448605.1 PAS domain S-box protein [Fulvivirga marina]